MSLLSSLLSLIWPEPRYRRQSVQSYGRITEGREIRGNQGRYPSGPKPAIRVVPQHPAPPKSRDERPTSYGYGVGIPTPHWVAPPAPPARRSKRRRP